MASTNPDASGPGLRLRDHAQSSVRTCKYAGSTQFPKYRQRLKVPTPAEGRLWGRRERGNECGRGG